MGTPMSLAAPLALISATILGLLSITAPLPLAILGYVWASLHLVAAVAAWNR